MTDGPELLRIGVDGVVPVQWSVEKSDEGPGTLTGWASVYNVVDQQDDVMAPGAFRKTIADWRRSKRVIPLTLDHQNTAEGVIGSLSKAEDTPYGLKTTFQFSSTSRAQETRIKAREGHLNGLSIWGPIFDKAMETVAGKSVRLLREVGLAFVGLTPMPANRDSLVLTAKQEVAIKPLERCQVDGQPGWRWGAGGKCYTYTAGDEASETAARKKALAQAAAMGEFPGTGRKDLEFDEFADVMQQALNINHPAAKRAAVHILLGSYRTEPAIETPEKEPVAADAVTKDTSGQEAAAYALSVIGEDGPGEDPPDGGPSDSLAGLFASLDAEKTKSELDSLEAEIRSESA